MMTSVVNSVIVVGAGPTGLAAAGELARAGVVVTIVDGAEEGANTSRAAVVHPRTLEVLSPLGVTDRILDRAVRVPRFVVRDGSNTIARLDFSTLDTPYPFTAMISQADTESILRERLRELGVEVAWGRRVLAVRAAAGAEVDVVDADGEATTLVADAVIGADGMHSTVRDQVGIDFPGSGYPQSFVLADVAMDWPVPRDTVSLTFARSGLVVAAPLPDNRFRIVATADDPSPTPSAQDIADLLRSRTGAGTLTDIGWSGRFRVHHRLAEHYRAGSVFLAGDAAHVHSPAGGQGMNTGIQDAVVLADVLASGADRDSYEARRRPVARRVLRMTGRMTRAATDGAPGIRIARNTAIRTALALPPVRHRLAMEISELAYR